MPCLFRAKGLQAVIDATGLGVNRDERQQLISPTLCSEAEKTKAASPQRGDTLIVVVRRKTGKSAGTERVGHRAPVKAGEM
jgi:hypothetical protein